MMKIKMIPRLLFLFFISFILMITIPFSSIVDATEYGILLDLDVDLYHIPMDITSNSVTRSYNHTVRVNQSDYYATVIAGNETSYFNGYLRTFKVNQSDGQIDTVFVDEYCYDVSYGYGSAINHIEDTDVYVCLTANTPTGGLWNATALRTFHISDVNGSISFIDEQNASIDINEGWYFKELIHFGEIYFLVCTTGSYSLRLQTYRIYDNGTINDIRLDKVSLVIDSKGPCVIKIDDNTAAIAFTNYNDNDGMLYTYDVSSSGIITLKDSWEFDNADGRYPTIFHVYDDVYGIFYSGVSGYAWVKTLHISDLGSITKSWIDTLEFTAGSGYTTTGYSNCIVINSVVSIPSHIGIYGFVFKDVVTSDGMIGTVDINETGIIGNSLINEIEAWDTDAITNKQNIIYMGNDYYLIVYDRTDYDHYLKTFEISTYDIGETIGILTVNAFDEATNENIDNFNVLVINDDGDSYSIYNQVNPCNISIDLLPLGDNVDIVVGATGYNSRTYVLGVEEQYFIVDGVNYLFVTINAYLPNTTSSNLYYIQVIDEYLYPVEDARVVIKGFFSNETNESYGTMSNTLTDSYGITSAYLMYGKEYHVTISKDGFITKTDTWIPDPSGYGIEYPKIFMINHEGTNVSETYDPWDYIVFEGWMYTNNTIKINYEDVILNGTIDATFRTYEINNSDMSSTLVSTNYTNDNIFTFWVYNINSSRNHRVVLRLNHTILDYRVMTILISQVNISDNINETDIENKITGVFGSFDLGYISFFFIFIPCIVLLVIPGINHNGIGIIGSSLWLGFSSMYFGLTSFTLISPFIFSIGMILFIVKGGASKL